MDNTFEHGDDVSKDVNQHVIDRAVAVCLIYRNKCLARRKSSGILETFFPPGTRRFIKLVKPGESNDIGCGLLFELPLTVDDSAEIKKLCGEWGVPVPKENRWLAYR